MKAILKSRRGIQSTLSITINEFQIVYITSTWWCNFGKQTEVPTFFYQDEA